MVNELGPVLEQIELPFVVFDQQFMPVVLSMSGARCLGIKDKSNLREHLELLAPLQRFAKQAARPINTLADRHQLEELELEAIGGRTFKALAYSRSVSISGASPSEVPHLVVFQDLTHFEPFFKSIEQSRRTRALVVLLSSSLGRHFDMRSADELSALAQKGVEAFSSLPPLAMTTAVGSDLLKELSTAVDIVDPLIIPSSKILVDLKSSALLAIPRTACLRILSHLLLEATDFGGPFGKTTVTGELDDRPKDSLKTIGYTVFIRGERQAELPPSAGPLEIYLYRLYVPSQYRVNVFEPGHSEGKRTLRKRGDSRTISRDLLSENLLIANEIGVQHGIELEFSRPDPLVLQLALHCRLA